MKEVENNNTEQALTPAIKEGAGIFLMTSHKLVLCESPIEFVKALQGVYYSCKRPVSYTSC